MSDAPSLRETLETAMDAGETSEAIESQAVAPPEVEAAPEQQVEDTRTAAERARDDKGRFATKIEKATAPAKVGEKADGKAAAVAPQGKPAVAPPPATAGQPAAIDPKPSTVKAPQAFKAAVRELSQKLPAEFHPILEEAVRIDNEAKKALNDSAQARHLAQQVQQTLAPYETIARANGMDSMQFAGSVLQTAAQLQMGSPQQKAAVVAQIIGSYGVDIQTLAAMLDGKAPAPQQQQAPQDIGRMVQQEIERREQETRGQQAHQAWSEFTATAPEFLEDVRGEMALIIEKAGREGRNITFQQAYDQACKLNDGVRDVITQRDAAKKATDAARAKAPTVQQAKAAAVMVKGSPGTTATRPAGPRSLRDDLEAAVAGQRT